VRANESLKDRIRSHRRDGLRNRSKLVHVPSRERVAVGEAIRLEIGLGPHADEVVLDGTIVDVQPGSGETDGADGGAPIVVCRIEQRHADRLAYILEVLEGDRQPVARRFRRVRARVTVRWSARAKSPTRVHHTFTADLSAGGAFIVCRDSPLRDTTLSIELRLQPGEAPIELEAVVTWSGTAHGQPGFGVKFNHVDRTVFARLQDIVDEHEGA
jgi:uncharacterized protein (TIGR02266 family)